MSGLSKVEMSAFIRGGGRYGNGANRFEPTRTGPATRATRDSAKAADADGAARPLKISDRHIRRLLFGLGERGNRVVISASHGHDFEKRKASFGTVGKKYSYFLHGAKETQNRSVIVLFWLPTVPQFVSQQRDVTAKRVQRIGIGQRDRKSSDVCFQMVEFSNLG